METGFQLYGAGGPKTEAITSFLMILFYMVMMIVGLTSARHNVMTSVGYKYYFYVASMMGANTAACLGGALVSVHINSGLCMSDMSRYFYSSLLGPIVYICFLQTHFTTTLQSFQFSYRSQLDEEDEYHEDDLYGNISTSSSINILRSPIVDEQHM